MYNLQLKECLLFRLLSINFHLITFFYTHKKKALNSRKFSTSCFRWNLVNLACRPFGVFRGFLLNSHKYELGFLRNTPHGRHTTYSLRSHKRTIGLKPTATTTTKNRKQQKILPDYSEKEKREIWLLNLLTRRNPAKIYLSYSIFTPYFRIYMLLVFTAKTGNGYI